MEARADTVTVTLPDGSTRAVRRGTTVREVAQGIGQRLAKDAWAGKLDGKVVDLVTPIESDASLEIITAKSPDAVPIYRHSTAHLTAQAVKRLFPDVQIGIGPPIENGYYYDFNPARPFTPEDLAAIEAEMRKIVGEDLPIERMEMPLAEAVSIFEKQADALKVEIARGIPEGERVSCYRQGDEHNPMLQRIYGASFLTQKELDEYVKRMEEAKEHDHRKLGRELDLFSFHPWAPASPFFHPKGAALYNCLLDYLRSEYASRGYQEVVTPQIFDAELFKLSGHYANYHENMYWTEIDEREFGVKPMNCPGQFLLYKTRLWSYRDLPVRFADFGRLHRYELSGVTAGLTRVRTFSQDDAHIFAPFEKVEDEIFRFLDFVDAVYGAFGFTDVEISLGLRPQKRIGADELWDRGEVALAAALEKAKRPHVVTPGDGAFYGPKIDFRVKDALGRPWQLGTIQCDFEHGESFDLTYIGEDGQQHRPVVLHRAILGSVERFLGILIEHTAGNFPFWIAPVHAAVLPVSDRFAAAAREVAGRLGAAGLRVELDDRNEKLGIGEREAAAGTVSVRLRHGGDAGTLALEEFLSLARRAIAEKSGELAVEVKNR